MKIRVLSDLHVDVNELYAAHRAIHLNDDIFTIVAGDTAGTPEEAISWIKQNIRTGLVIAGNHIVYSGDRRPIQDLKKQMAQSFSQKSPITFLDQMTGIMSKEINNILFVGTTLYTNYSLLPGSSENDAMWYAQRHMNDFRIGYTRDKNRVRPITPKDYQRWFLESVKEITRIARANPQKEIVIITHHCPSGRCCSDGYNLLNSSYASDLEPFILKHPNIKLWIAGHIHHRKNFKIGNCLVLMNPRGYEHEGEGLGFNPNMFIETQDWSVQYAPLKNKQDKIDFQQLAKRACLEL